MVKRVSEIESDPICPFLKAQFDLGVSSGNWTGAINEIASRTPAIAPVVKLITNVGVNHFLDMLIGTSLGKPVYNFTTDASFAGNAQTYFSALTPAVIQSMHAELMPTSAVAMVAKAQTDVNARAALAALSSISVEVAPSIAANLDLYDPATGSGELTDLYLKDRAAMLSWKMKYDSGARDDDGAADDFFRVGNKPYSADWDTNATLLGGAGQDTLSGGAGVDTLIGGTGNDTVWGEGGSDVILGGAGNDHLEGGVGDTLSLTSTAATLPAAFPAPRPVAAARSKRGCRCRARSVTHTSGRYPRETPALPAKYPAACARP